MLWLASDMNRRLDIAPSLSQSATYRSIIDDVIHNVRQDFEEMGIEKEVLEELQRVSATNLPLPVASIASTEADRS